MSSKKKKIKTKQKTHGPSLISGLQSFRLAHSPPYANTEADLQVRVH